MTDRTLPALLSRLTARATTRVERARRRGDAGFILLESMIAITLITVIMGAVGAEYVASVAASDGARLRITATQLASSQMEQIRALQPSDLTTGRGNSAVNAERTIIAKFPTSVSAADLEAYDSTAASAATGTTISTTPTTSTIGNTIFTVYRYFECEADPAASGSCVTPATQSTPAYNNLRALVVVTWPQHGCAGVTTPSTSGPTCSVTSSSVINDDSDLTFDLNQPLPSAPVVNPVSSLTVAGGDLVSYALTTTSRNSGVAPLTWRLTSGSLPSGLTVSTGGLIAGTVSTPATSTTTVTSTFTVTDAFNRTASQPITWTVEPTLTMSIAPQASLTGRAISTVTVAATGGSGSGYTYADPKATLPPGLTISSSGVITGTPTGSPKTYVVSLTATDPQACPACARTPRTVTTTVNWSINNPPLAVTAPADQTATVNTTLTPVKQVVMAAAGGDGNYAWSISGQPTGLGINSSSGLITGTPIAIGTYSVSVTLTDTSAGVSPSTVRFSWSIVAKPSLTTPGAQTSAVGAAVSLPTSPVCPDAPCTYTLSNAPTNLTIDSSGDIQGTIGGGAKTYSGVTVTVTDSAGAGATTSAFTWTVVAPPTIGSLGFQSFTETAHESVPLTYTCPAGTCTITLSGSVPPGLGLTTAAASSSDNTSKTSLSVTGSGTVYVTGKVLNTAVTGSGTTSAAYQPSATLTTPDSSQATTTPVTWTAYTVPTLRTPGDLTSTSYAAVNLPVTTSCPDSPCSYGLAGAPTGLSINASTGVISGTITSGAASFSGVSVTATDRDGVAKTVSFTWTVVATVNNLASFFTNVGVTQNSNTAAGNYDGVGDTFSASTLASAGVTAGSTVVSNGLSFTWPTTSGTGQPDNTLASGQTVTISGNGSKLGFLLSGAYGAASGTATITYTDGTTQPFTLSTPDWWGAAGTSGVVINNAYYNGTNNSQNTQSVNVYYAGVTLRAGKTVASVKLPNISSGVGSGTNSMHIFAVSLTAATLADSYNNVGVTADNATSNGNFDGVGNSFSTTALQKAGLTSGSDFTKKGVTFTWPSPAGSGSVDNTVASGQQIAWSGNTSGGTLGFLLSGAYGASSGSGTVTFTDGTVQTFTLATQDWVGSTSGYTVAANSAYQNNQNNTSTSTHSYVFVATVALNAGETIASVQLPTISTGVGSNVTAMHIFAMGVN